MTDERISRISSSGMLFCVITELSTVTVSRSRVTVQPRWRRILTVASISDSSGQLRITFTPLHTMDAARIGSALFFAP